MKIVIDARFWGPSHTGLGVYTRELVENIAKIDTTNSYTILLTADSFGQVQLPSNFHKKLVNARAYTFWEQILVAIVLYSLRPDLVHFPSINVPILYFGKYVVTVHDLIKHHSRGIATTTHSPIFYWLKYATYLLVTKLTVLRSKKIVVPSNQVKHEIITTFKVPPEKIAVTYEAASLIKSNKSADLKLPAKFAVYTGNAYPHKNLDRLIAIWPKIFQKTNTVLIISSGRSTFSSKIEKLIDKNIAQQSIKFLGFLSDDQLSYAYSQATMYVFPTLLEGFGLPGLDAMSLGLPVVCSDIPVLREVYGPAALYFDPKSEQDMISKITMIATNKDVRKKLIEQGISQVKKYSWKKMATETLSVYNSV